jgi:tRNA(adenine34) deaminase
MSQTNHETFMRVAIEQAQLAQSVGEVPIGAVLVLDGTVLARAFNQPISAVDPTAHAEVLALRDAARVIGNYRLTGATVYVTVEPCLMCVGALVHARVLEVVYGTVEPRTGALVSAVPALDTPGLNHRFAVTGGVLEEECRSLMQEFFRERRRPGGASSGGGPQVEDVLADSKSRRL